MELFIVIIFGIPIALYVGASIYQYCNTGTCLFECKPFFEKLKLKIITKRK